MTLEDFFTLTEMKDGLIVPARVEELIAVMKTVNDCILKNAGDAMRQWSTVAAVIAVTENKDCLDLFIRLDGLVYIDRWLKDAQTISGDSNDSLVEESILALLHALEKLGIGNEKLTSSGIYLTVRDLLSHKSNNIQYKAKAFLEHFKPPTVSGEVKLDSEEGQAVPHETSQPENRRAVGRSDAPKSSSAISPDQKADVDQHVHQLVGNIAASSGCGVNQQSEGVEAVVKEPDKLADHFSECDLKEVNDKVEYSVRKEACSSERKSRSDSPDTEQGIDMRREISRLGSLLEVVNAEVHNENLSNKLGKAEVNPASKSYVLETDGNAGRGTDNHVVSADLPTGGISTRADDRGILMNCTATLAQKTPSQGDESSTNTSQDSSDDGSMLRNSQDLDNTYPQTDDVKYDPSHLRGSRGFEASISCKSADVTSKSSAMDLEYGMVDALEVACLVAKEVERQVAEEEQFGSFPKKSSRGDSFNGKKDEHADGNPSNESPVEKMFVEDSSGEDEPSLNSDTMDAEQENDTRVVESSQVTDIAPEAAKGTSEFDLNLEICSEAAEDVASNSVSNPVAIVSASRAVAVPGLPASPLEFEGALGWKGSAATSAFRPASPRRIDEVATNKASRQGQDFVFDLNLAEDESLAEPTPRKSEKLSFDLNLMSEDRDAPFSPSLKPSSSMNFDLNDNPLNFCDTSDLLPYLGASSSHQVNSYGGSSENSVISIMGAKVKQSSTTFLHQGPFSFFNGGRASEPVGPAMSGPPPLAPYPIYSYNGIAVGPAMSFSPQMYGPGGSAAYMVDPRVMGGAPPSTFQAPFALQPSFTTNMVGPLPGPNGISSFQTHLGFNPGFVMEGASNRVDAGGFRQLFPGQGRSAEVQLQPLFPGIGGKRKEPDGGWEFHQPPPHL